MKTCPRCSQTFSDDTLSFCLNDGTPLVGLESQPTLRMSQPTVIAARPAEKKKGRAALWAGLAVLMMVVVGAAALAGIYLYSQRDSANANRRTAADTSPRRNATPISDGKPSLTSDNMADNSNRRSSIKSDEFDDRSRGTPPAADAPDDTTPISWDTNAGGFTGEAGRTYRFECPPDGTPGIVWGSDIYTQDSSICTAAVHAGIITLERGGTITLEYRPGRPIYGSTTRNGIKSHPFGQYPRSFIVR